MVRRQRSTLIDFNAPLYYVYILRQFQNIVTQFQISSKRLLLYLYHVITSIFPNDISGLFRDRVYCCLSVTPSLQGKDTGVHNTQVGCPIDLSA